MISIDMLGNKICIIGCSSSGKSTLADKLSAKLNIPAFHLDILAHHPHTKWRRKADQDLINAHNDILKNDNWIIDGNYSVCMQDRISHATSIIWLDANVIAAAWRYLLRSLRRNPDRSGVLPDAQSEFSLFMLKQILLIYPKNRAKYRNLINACGKQFVYIKSMKNLTVYYRYWEL